VESCILRLPEVLIMIVVMEMVLQLWKFNEMSGICGGGLMI
jgi:hypothetical protein